MPFIVISSNLEKNFANSNFLTLNGAGGINVTLPSPTLLQLKCSL